MGRWGGGEVGRWGDEEMGGHQTQIMTNAPCPMPYALFPFLKILHTII
ncbi:hypothetical protein [Nostoc linckia]|nr:hypothetical protein [Nostoc linckia]